MWSRLDTRASDRHRTRVLLLVLLLLQLYSTPRNLISGLVFLRKDEFRISVVSDLESRVAFQISKLSEVQIFEIRARISFCLDQRKPRSPILTDAPAAPARPAGLSPPRRRGQHAAVQAADRLEAPPLRKYALGSPPPR